jgi:1,4-alpha-glucan branching enzyme
MPHENYSLPFPTAGTWTEVLNTDDLAYGGSGITNETVVISDAAQLASAVRVPPLATIWFKRS